ncbi:MAG: SIS domain-containing protein [Clostridia bacterium]|nr:SIS domain-containing protein [Clostridia bacterium]
MFLTEKEILDTPVALAKTCEVFDKQAKEIADFFAANTQRKFTFFGCGSSYMLSKSAATIFAAKPDTYASAIPAGDYIVNPTFWKETVKNSIIVTISRSGKTSEMVRAVKHIKENYGCPVISLSMKDDNDIMPMSGLDITMDWCYDNSVCQTRTVTNLYAAVLLLAAAYSNDTVLAQSVKDAAKLNADFIAKNRPVLEQIAALDWRDVTVLADGPVCGIAEEGALAFTEIVMLTGRYFRMLDYRHGPIVISGKQSLTLMLLNPSEDSLQGDMVRDVMAHGGPVVTVSNKAENIYGATAHIQIDGIEDFAAFGIPFIYLAQMTAFLKSISLGGNPDAPTGLDAYITLK